MKHSEALARPGTSVWQQPINDEFFYSSTGANLSFTWALPCPRTSRLVSLAPLFTLLTHQLFQVKPFSLISPA